jgi:hypothetical protein
VFGDRGAQLRAAPRCRGRPLLTRAHGQRVAGPSRDARSPGPGAAQRRAGRRTA